MELVGTGGSGITREPNSTPMVTLCWGWKRPSHRRRVRDVFPQAESPMLTTFCGGGERGES